MMFSMNPVKASYVEKNNYHAIQKPGWIQLEIVPIKRQEGLSHLEWDKKKQFNLGLKQIGALISTRNKTMDEESKFETSILIIIIEVFPMLHHKNKRKT